MVSKKPDDTKKPTKRAASKRGAATTKRSTSTKRSTTTKQSTTAAPVTDQRLAAAQERLGYAFKNLDLLTRALCHSSIRNEGFASNERLEFLGDAVLSLLVSWFLYEGLPDANEGELSARRVQMTRGEHLATIAERIGLSQLIRTGKNQDLEPTASMQSDLIEACLGAIFLDGGLDAAQNFVLSHVIAAPKGGEMKAAAPEAYTDAKSQLQHFTLARRLGLPEYREVSVEGPAHAQMFTMEVLVAEKVLGTGSGSSKKTAQQAAAQQAFDVLREAESRAGPANGDDAGDGPEDS